MRICLYTESALPLVGGQEIVVDQLAREFLKLGHEVAVLAARHRGRAVIRDYELPYKVVRHPRFISTHRFLSWYKRYLENLRRQFPFDVLHCHSVQPTGYVAACWPGSKDLRVVITSHCGDICPDSRLLAKPRALDRCRKALQRADAAVAISEFAEQCLRGIYPELAIVERIVNGVSCSHFASTMLRTTRAVSNVTPGKYFLFLGRIVERKGVDLLLQAFAQASTSIDAQCVIAGSGVDLDAMRLLAKHLQIDSRVHFLGHIDGDDKTWLLQNAIATVMPSRLWEGCPLVALESFAAGRPVIATKTAGLQELVQQDHTGILVAAGSATRLAEALVRATCNRSQTDRMGKSAAAFAREHDWSCVAQRYLDLFDRLLNQSRRDVPCQRSAA
jgi:glycosyltransferase involved in cell wall biosynthesis